MWAYSDARKAGFISGIKITYRSDAVKILVVSRILNTELHEIHHLFLTAVLVFLIRVQKTPKGYSAFVSVTCGVI